MNFFKPKFWGKNKTSFFAILLFPISLLVSIFIYSKHILVKSKQPGIPVICIGNIYLGGTGKTPLCIEIYSILKGLNKNPAFIRKEYKHYEDEVNLMKNVGPIFQNKKRIDAINQAIKNKIDVAILDDGFQDISINKNLIIICFNEKQWIGNGLTIPAGPLRESLSALKRANCVVINGNKNEEIENQINKENNDIKIFYTKYIPINFNNFLNKKIIAFAGIGNPTNFFDLLKENKINTLENLSFPDHHPYSNEELDNLLKKAEENNAILLTTKKDYYRIDKNYQKNINYLEILLNIKNKDKFIEEIKKII